MQKYDSNWRICSKCKIYKTWNLFSKDRTHGSWYTTACLDCRNKQLRERRSTIEWKSKDKIYHLNYKLKHHDKLKECRKVYKENNKEKIQWQQKVYYSTPSVKEKKNEQRRYRTDLYFRKWKFVIYWTYRSKREDLKWLKGKILERVQWKWCLIHFENDFKLWIWIEHLKPVKKKYNFSTYQ